MPIYSYKCTKCGKEYDKMRPFSDSDSSDICPNCGGEARRVFTEPGAVIYKGTGYYCTDHPHSEGCNCSNCKRK